MKIIIKKRHYIFIKFTYRNVKFTLIHYSKIHSNMFSTQILYNPLYFPIQSNVYNVWCQDSHESFKMKFESSYIKSSSYFNIRKRPVNLIYLISIGTFKWKFWIRNAFFKTSLFVLKKSYRYILSISELYSIIFWIFKGNHSVVCRCVGYKRKILIRQKCYSYWVSFSAFIKMISNCLSGEWVFWKF